LTKPYTPEKPISLLFLVFIKLTRKLPGQGRRLFRMAPLHHHFEAVFSEKHISEAAIVNAFAFVQLVICVLVLLLFHWKLYS